MMKYSMLIMLVSFFTYIYAQGEKPSSSNNCTLSLCFHSSSSLNINNLLIKNVNRLSQRIISLPKNIFSVTAPWAILYHYKLLDSSDYVKDLRVIFAFSLFVDSLLSGPPDSLRDVINNFLYSCKDTLLMLLIFLVSLDKLCTQVKTILIGLLFTNEIAEFLKDTACFTFQKYMLVNK